ncbi:PKD domain-containing protein [Pseudoalteromonas sp. T1lg76]|uniref:PKD domain-containing protein n=1 Tax=Pseudoalteromonas sp. T1lg76 TaxID=2077103 RepID=UPI001319B95B|nr:hypothetical protein [Pseudoalteromonas sp. T1lg76]
MLLSGRIRFMCLFVLFLLFGCHKHNRDERIVDIEALSTPVVMTASKGSLDGVHLTWPPLPGAGSYTLHRCEVPEGITDDLVESTPTDCGVPIIITSELGYIDVPPQTAPQAYVYRLRACSASDANICGTTIASVVAAQASAPEVPQLTTNIGDHGRQVISGLTTRLHAFAYNASGNVTWNWKQEGGPKVTLAGADTSELSFTAPDVMTNTLLSFELRASDDNGNGRPSKVAITVVPANNVSVKTGSSSRLTQSGHKVTLHARGSDSGLDYQWRQIAPDSPIVTLNGADTANPDFIAPSMPQGGILHFEVKVTDPVTGRNASARTAVEVQYAVPTVTPILEPSQTPVLVPTPVPMAAPLLKPLLIAQPLQVPHPRQVEPVPSPILVPPKVPPQALILLASPAVAATAGTRVELSMTANGGRPPYQWQWSQISGPTADLEASTQEVLTVQLPVVDTAQVLTFEAKVTDAEGIERTAEAVVHAMLTPEVATGVTPTPITSLEPRLVVVGESAPVLNSLLSDLTVEQIAGPKLQIAQQPDSSGTGTQILVTAPLVKQHSAHAMLSVTGKDLQGAVVRYILPVLIIRPQAIDPPVESPPQVLPPQEAPKQDDPLVIIAGTAGVILQEGSLKALGVVAQGGKGRENYRYLWSYLKEENGPDVSFSGADTARIVVTAPAVQQTTLLRFNVQVSDGVQTTDRDVLVQVNDVAASLVIGDLAPLTVDSGQEVSLSSPTPTGGVQFPTHEHYRYSITQIGGSQSVTLTPIGDQEADRISNWRFVAPTLFPGDADLVLLFELASYDRVGNVVKTTQQVRVSAPPPPEPLVATMSSPVNIALGTSLTLQADVTGGAAPYSFAWQIQPHVQAIPGKPAFNLGASNATGKNPTVSIDNLGLRRDEAASYQLEVSLTVTDANLQVSEATSVTRVVLSDALRSATEALVCGHLDNKEPCTDLDLVLGMTTKCPVHQPYALNLIKQQDDLVEEYRWCADARTVFNLSIASGNIDNPLCRNFNPGASRDLTCYLACYGDGCNIDTIPPDGTLLGTLGSDGYLKVGMPPLNN